MGIKRISKSQQRWVLALTITLVSFLGIGFISFLAMSYTGEADRKQTALMIFSSVLPLLAAWIGAVLAYYFSSESLAAATQSVKTLSNLDDKLKSVSVSQAMIKLQDIIYWTYDDSLKIKDIFDRLKKENKGERIPIFNSKNEPMYMLHKSSIDNSISKEVMNQQKIAPGTVDLFSLTLKSLLDSDSDLKSMAENSFGTIGKNATLADTKTLMQSAKIYQDIFVTESGKKDSPVIGWITNVILEDFSKV